MNKQITVFTDGGCRNYHNKKGEHVNKNDLSAWAFRVDYPNGMTVHRSNYALGATNNQMELQAVIEALSFLTNGGLTTLNAPRITVVTDSQYLHNSITKGYINKWQKKKFKNVKNAEKWKFLLSLICRIKQFHIKWTKGHSDGKTYDSSGNNFVDHLLNHTMDQYIKNQKQNKKQTSKE